MKHSFVKRSLFVAVAAAGLLAGCQKEEGPVTLGIETEGVGGARNGAKVIISDYTPVWEGGESVLINGETKEVTLVGSPAQAQLQGLAEASTYRAVYPASWVNGSNISSSASVSMTVLATQTYETDDSGNQKVVVPMGAYLDDNGGTLHFKNLCSLVKLTVNNTNAAGDIAITVTSIELSTSTSGTDLCGTGTATVNGTADDAIFTVSSNGSQRITLDLGDDGVEIAAGGSHEFYFVVAPFASSSDMTFTVNTNVTGETFTRSAQNKTLPRNTIAAASISISGTPEPPTPTAIGSFKVSDSKTVAFAPGNLRYTEGADHPWSFCSTQYEYNASNNGSNGVWEYFGWSTNATTYGMNTSTSSSTYSGDFEDWGNAVNNQGNLGTGWRTLTSGEWGYIFNIRPGATINSKENCRYLRATVCDKAGVILIPDGCTWPAGVSYSNESNFNSTNLSFATNNYKDDDWDKLEGVGCVFLPAAGYRNGTTVSNAGSYGNYWSSTANSTTDAYNLFFNGSNLNPQYYSNRRNGFSVRFVQDKN